LRSTVGLRRQTEAVHAGKIPFHELLHQLSGRSPKAVARVRQVARDCTNVARGVMIAGTTQIGRKRIGIGASPSRLSAANEYRVAS
jgi:hypothetical protein